MRKLWIPSQRPLVNPSTGDRVLRRPDLRAFWDGRLSGMPLTDLERDFDELVVHRSWREYDPARPDAVKYFRKAAVFFAKETGR
jgi:hypothetical protein